MIFLNKIMEWAFCDLTVNIVGRDGCDDDAKHDKGASKVGPDVNCLIMELKEAF